MPISNPLLMLQELPAFSKLEIADIEPAIDYKLAASRQQISTLLEQVANEPTWSNFVEPLETMADELEQLWSPISHLNGVMNSEALRTAYNNCLPKLSEYATELGQNRELYNAFYQIAQDQQFQRLSQAQRKVIDNKLRDFHLCGIDLEEAPKKRFAQISKRLAELGSQFSDHVLDATQAWSKQILDKQELAGLPEMALDSAAQAAKSRDLQGYLITLDIPSYLPVMMYCENDTLREELYVAYVTRASDQGPNAEQWDNSSLMQEILALRHESAILLGFNNYAEYSLATKMAGSTQQVIDFLEDLAHKSLPVAEADFAELEAFARGEGDKASIAAWDVAYYSEKLRQNKYAVSQEELRPYFPVARVIQGLFEVVKKLYGIEFQQQQTVDTWHCDVQFFHLLKDGQLIAKFYLDLYARENKRGGAWMADCRCRRRRADGALQLPVAFLTCNFTVPTEALPSLLTHNEVTTLFHEFGHGLHHMLTGIEVLSVSGINGVEWDAVELPSQFLENWCWEKQALALISGHYESDQALPAELLDKLIAAKNFQSGMQMVRQLEFALFDMRMHKEYQVDNPQDIQDLLQEIRNQVAVYKTPALNRFQHSFNHVFAGGYAAGYYSYKWAEVLSADAFSLFEENGVFDITTGQRFLVEILQKGGSEEAMQLFVNYRGREPRVDALLRHSGIVS